MCGLITCTNCTGFQRVIAEWSADKQRVCKRCAVPTEAVTMEGFLLKQGQKHTIFGEKFQQRYFELRGAVLLYGKDKSSLHGQIDLEHGKVMEVAIHPNAFCLIGPRLQRGYVLSAETAEKKMEWMQKIQSNIEAVRKKKDDGDDGDDSDDDMATERVLLVPPGLQSSPSGNQQPTVLMSDFQVQTVLGIGSFGRVMKVKEKKTGNVYAMKVLDKSQIVANKMVAHTQAEKAILAEVDHPFICKLHFAFQTKKHLVLVLDFLCGGELFFHLQRNKRFSENRARFYAAEIGMALEYIHSKNIIYRDLKPENLVLDRNGHVVLTDFGLAKRDVHDMTHTFCGTPEYMAPELIQKKGHTSAVDWWSLGVFLYEMVSGLPPFYTQNVTEMYDLILNKPLKYPSFFSADLRSLLSGLLERDPSKRICGGEAFRNHPFFRGLDFERLYNREIRPEFVPDVATNDLRYFDKQFLQETTAVPNLDMPNDPNDATSKKFEGFEFASNDSGSLRQTSSVGGTPGSAKKPLEIPDIDL